MSTPGVRTRAALVVATACCAALVVSGIAGAVRNPPSVTADRCTVTAKRPTQALIPHDGKNYGAKAKYMTTTVRCTKTRTVFLDQELVEAVPGGLNPTLASRENVKFVAHAGVSVGIRTKTCRVTEGVTAYNRSSFRVAGFNVVHVVSSRNVDFKRVHPDDLLIC